MLRLAVLLAEVLLLAQAAVAGPALRMNRARVNIRVDATVQSDLIAVLRTGREVEQIDTKDEWFRIRLPGGAEGWVHSDLVQKVLVVTANGVRIRAAGSTAAPVVGAARTGDELGEIDRQGNWVQVSLPNGERGWIWTRLVRPKVIEITPLPEEVPEAAEEETDSLPIPIAQEEEETPDDPTQSEAPVVEVAEEEVAESEPEGMLSSPFVEGLQRELDGDFQGALERFEAMLAQEPTHLKALSHAAEAHKRLGEYDLAQRKLLRALELGKRPREVFADLAEVYRLAGAADSAGKYLALSRGEEWSPGQLESGPAESETQGRSLTDLLWIYAAVVGGSSALLIALVVLLRRQKSGQEPREKKDKFAQTMRQTEDPLEVGEGEEQELDRQIEAKRAELRESSAAFLDAGPGGMAADGLEDQHLEKFLGQLEALRQALEMQDERAQIYADIVRLQNMKIEAMSQQLQMLRRRSKG